MRQLFLRIRDLLPRPDKRDVLVFGGILLITAGVAMVYRPAALIVAGALCMRIGLIGLPVQPRER